MYVCMYLIKIHISEPNFAQVSPFIWKRPQGMYGPKMAAGVTVFCDTLISVVTAGVRVTSPTLRCRRQQSHPRQPYIRDSSRSSPNIVEITS